MTAAPIRDLDRLLTDVLSRTGAGTDPRLAEVLASVVTHLHTAVLEVRPSAQEWLQALGFPSAPARPARSSATK